MAENEITEQADDDVSFSLTLRGLSLRFEENTTAQAKRAGKPKGTYVREYLEQGLSDPIINYTLINPLSISLDEELAQYVGGQLDEKSFQNYLSYTINSLYRRILDINSNDDLRRILISNTPYLFKRADQVLTDSDHILRGVAMAFAMFSEMAGRDKETIEKGWKDLFRSNRAGAYEQYMLHIDEIRKLKNLESINQASDLQTEWGSIYIYRPEGYQHGAWRVILTLDSSVHNIDWSLPFPVLKGRVLCADPGYVGLVNVDGEGYSPGFKFNNRRSELHLYTTGISEEENPITPRDVAYHLDDILEKNML